MGGGLSICSLRSGSDGNAILVSGGRTKILVDCGLSGKYIEGCLSKIGVYPQEIDAIVVTHEHSDHIQSVGVMMRRYKLPVFANSLTIRAMLGKIGNVNTARIHEFSDNKAFEIDKIGVIPFTIPHDAASPVGYSFFYGNEKVTVATDIGHVNEEIYNAVRGSDTVLLEANHDINMLDFGRYPIYLKRRIKSDTGHLSNDSAAELAARLVNSGTKQIVLGHLSGENNTPELAYETVNAVLKAKKIKADRDILLDVATRFEMSKVYNAAV